MKHCMPPSTSGVIVWACVNALRHGLWLAFFLANAAHAANVLVDAIAESKFFGYGKIMFVADDKKGGRLNQHTPGFGGRLGMETGSLLGQGPVDLRFKAAWYTTQDFGLRSNNPRKTDAYMFDLDKTPYSLLGEAQLVGKFGNTTLTAGRQEIHSPLINSYDYRIIPNLFEAISLVNRDLPETTLTLAHVRKMSGFDGLTTFSRFRSMSEQAYTSLLVTPDGAVDSVNGNTLVPSRIVGDQGVWLAGVELKSRHTVRVWNAYGTNLLNTLYGDVKLTWPLRETLSVSLEGQAYRVSALGRFKEYLSGHGLNANYALVGVKGTLAHKPGGVSVGLAFNRFGGSDRTVTAFGNWGGYPEFVSMPYLFAEGRSVSAIARSQLVKLTALFDLGPYGLSGHSLLFGHARINLDEAILPGSDIIVNSLLYRSKLSDKLSARLALEFRNSGNSRYDNEFIAVSLRYDF